MGSLTRRPYLLVGFFHMIIGFLLCGCGLTWLLLTIFYWPSMKAGGDEPVSWKAADPWSNFPIQHQVWCWLVYTAQIWTGFWIMLSGCFAMCVKDKGCLEGLFLFMNTTSLLIFAPAAIILSLELFFNVATVNDIDKLQSMSFIYSAYPDSQFLFSNFDLNNTHYPWILTFPIAGLSLGFIELVLSFVSCGVCVCCRPTRTYQF